jgi:pimeloyl-ACP methyl ester carboxylesterase
MNTERIHTTVSADGTEIVGHVVGEGPPIVLLPAGPGDSQTCWQFVVPYLSERFTCYLVNTRGRGLSADAPDHAPGRLVEDIVAFAESIGERVGLVGWGDSLWALVAAEGPPPVSAVAAYEPGADEVISEEIATRFADAFARIEDLAADKRLDAAAQTFIEASDLIYGEEELDGGMPQAFWRASAPNLPLFLQEMGQLAEAAEPSPTAPSVLTKITAPLLLLHGTQSRRWFRSSLRHVAGYVAGSDIQAIEGAAHFGPHTHPEAVADALARFFSANPLSQNG